MNIDGIPLPIVLRLRVIEVLIDDYGYVSRATLSDLFGLGVAAISKDIATYNKVNEGACFYNRSTRRIEKLSNFKRVFE